MKFEASTYHVVRIEMFNPTVQLGFLRRLQCHRSAKLCFWFFQLNSCRLLLFPKHALQTHSKKKIMVSIVIPIVWLREALLSDF